MDAQFIIDDCEVGERAANALAYRLREENFWHQGRCAVYRRGLWGVRIKVDIRAEDSEDVARVQAVVEGALDRLASELGPGDWSIDLWRDHGNG